MSKREVVAREVRRGVLGAAERPGEARGDGDAEDLVALAEQVAEHLLED